MLSWSDFPFSGFSPAAPHLARCSSSILLSTKQQADITRKVKKMQTFFPPFGWETEPVMGTEVIIEEASVDVLCDLGYGGGWIDIGREEVDRE
jgi:hypothetical protein